MALSGPNDGWAVGYDGAILRLSGGTWSVVQGPTAQHLWSVTLSGPNDGWALGDNGAILRLSEGTWRMAASPSGQNLFSTALGKSHSWAVGQGGVILQGPGEVGPSSRWLYLPAILR